MSVCVVLCNHKKIVQKYYIYYFFCLYEKKSREQKKSQEQRTCIIKKHERNRYELGNQNKIGIDTKIEASITRIGWKRSIQRNQDLDGNRSEA